MSNIKRFIYIFISTYIDMTIEDNIKLLKALSEETRYRIIEVLLNGERCACEIPIIIGRTQPNTSMHLAKLLDWGIVKSIREGKTIRYSIKDNRVKKILKILGFIPKTEPRSCNLKK